MLIVIGPVIGAAAATGTISAVFIDSTGAELGNSSLTLPADSVGEQVIILLKVSGATNLWAVKTDLTWNNNVLHLNTVAKGNDPASTASFLGKTPTSSTLFVGDDPSTWKVDANGNGYVNGGVSETRMLSTATTSTGGSWCTLYFDIVGYGNSNIALSNAIVANTANEQSTATTSGVSVAVPSSIIMRNLAVTSAHGTPSPIGTVSYTSGTSITATVTSPVTENTLSYTCTGWSGTGSVPASGSATSITFSLTTDSTITWNWIPTPVGTPTPTPTATPVPTNTPIPTATLPPTATPVPISLTVFSEHGSPNPAVGSNNYGSGTSVTASVATTPLSVNGVTYNTITEGGVIYVCTGWTGSGSVSSSGTGTTTTFTINSASTITWNWILLPPSIDVSTNRGGQGWNASSNAFGPQEQVTLIANVTSGGSAVSQQSVSFSIIDNGAQIDSRTATTNTSGIATLTYRLQWSSVNPTSAFGIFNITSSVNIGSSQAIDSCAFMYNYLLNVTNIAVTNSDGHSSTINGPYFSRYSGPSVTASITVRNINWNAPTAFYLTATVYDNNNVPVAYSSAPQTILEATSGNPLSTHSQTYTVTLNLPSYAFVGPAKLYINLYTDDPTKMGISACPEQSALLVIESTQ